MSMKKKLVTAVTAASLLATVFGSSVFAAGRPTPTPAPTGFPIAKYTLIPTEGAALTQAGETAVFGFYSDDADVAVAEDTATLTYKFFVAGANNLGTTELTTADLRAVSSNSNILVAWAYADNGDAAVCEELDFDASTDPDTATKFVTTDIVEGVADGNPGEYTLCVAAKTATTAATGTITVSASKVTDAASSWVTMKSVTVTAIGALKSLELSLTTGYKYVAGANAAIDKALTLVGKDANGTVLNGATGSITAGVALSGIVESADNAENADGEAIPFFTNSSDEPVAVGATNAGSMRLFDIDAAACTVGNGDDVLGDVGRSYSIAVEDSTGLIVSNAISITCTGDGSEAVLKSVAAEVTSFKGKTYQSATGGSTFKIIGTIVDENGLPMGDGANAMDFGVETFTGLAGLTVAGLDVDLAESEVVGGKAQIATLAPTNMAYKTHRYSIKVADSNLGSTEDVAKTYSMTYAVSNPTTITVKMNAARTVATVTVNFGADAEGESAYLEVETETGSVKTYRKIANASGVATWTIALRRQTVYMTASSDVSGVADSNLAVVTYR